MKSIYIVCDKDGNPFFADTQGKDQYQRVWAFKRKEEAEEGRNPGDIVIEFRPKKGKT